MTNKENFLKLVSGEDTKTIAEARQRKKNRAMLRESQLIAVKVLVKLDDLGWTQKDLAEKMKVTPQQINKILRGKENLTLESQIKLQSILNIPILASFYESEMNAMEERILTIEKRIEKIVEQTSLLTDSYQTSKTLKIGKQPYSYQYSQLAG